MVRSHICKGPALFLEAVHQGLDGREVILLGAVLVAVRNDGHGNRAVPVVPYLLAESGERAPHCVVKGRAGSRDISLLCEDGGCIRIGVPVYVGDLLAVEKDQGDELLLRVRVFLLRGLHSPEHLVEAHYGRLLYVPHGAAAVHDDDVVNLGFCLLLFHFFASLSVELPLLTTKTIGLLAFPFVSF